MSAIAHAASLRLTPKNRFSPVSSPTHAPSKQIRESSGLHLRLENVIGTTTSSTNAFDAIPEHNTFVCCAGPAAILSQVDENLNIIQRLFRARPNTSPINPISSFYNPSTPLSTPGKSRRSSPLKDGGFGIGSDVSLEYAVDSQAYVKASNRGRESTCVSLSQCGKFLAVGETGYNPRVALFSTASDAPSDVPLSVLTDHSFGISSVAFSRDSRWLCTLGNSYDGFVLIYSINPTSGLARLHSSNKCSNVICVTWMGSSVISIGIRHVKVWRLEGAIPSSPSRARCDLENNVAKPPGSRTPRTFSGRNCLLGDLLDATFTAVVAISESNAILCTAQGDLCLLDDTDRTQRLEKVAHVDFKVHCVTYDRKKGIVWAAGEKGIMKSMTLDELIKPTRCLTFSSVSSSIEADLTTSLDKKCIVAMGVVRSRLISVDTSRIIEMRTAEEVKKGSEATTASKTFPAHESAVLGVRSLLPKPTQDGPDFLTFSAKGTVLFWLLNGDCTGSIEVPLDRPSYPEDGDPNELKTVVPCESECLASGDKCGVLRLIDRSHNKNYATQAHNGDINGIAVSQTEDLTIVATCGRDRTLQLFRKDDLELQLFQTLDDHAAAIGDISFFDGPSTLLSISSDRTIIVRKMATGEVQSLAYLPIRVINLKASPVSFTGVTSEPNIVVVSTVDRQIQRYDISSGRLHHNFKASDPASGNSVLMNSLEVHKFDETSGSKLLLGVSSTDKSIRIHDYDTGSLLSREHGQLAVSAIKIIQGSNDNGPRNHLISCGLDGTVMMWTLTSNLRRNSEPNASPNKADEHESPTKPNGPLTQPLRRILSKAEISDLQKSLESDGDSISPMRAHSPSCARRRTSRLSLAVAPKVAAAPPLSNGLYTPPFSRGRFHRTYSQEHSPTGPSPQHKQYPRPKRPSLDDRRRSKSAANLNDLNDTAEQLCKDLQGFRKRLATAATEKINPDTAQDLEIELKNTVDALNENTRKIHMGSETLPGELLDNYLANMIDERLALKAKTDKEKKAKGEDAVNDNEDQRGAGTGAQREPT